jgi:hypothetical protein
LPNILADTPSSSAQTICLFLEMDKFQMLSNTNSEHHFG